MSRSFSESYAATPVSAVNTQNITVIAAQDYVGQSRVSYNNQMRLNLNVGATPTSQVLFCGPSRGSTSNQLTPKEELSLYGYIASMDASFSPYLQPTSQYSIMQQYRRNSGQYQSQPLQRPIS
jgi:hypothetical protein